jgi:hypothetical protein
MAIVRKAKEIKLRLSDENIRLLKQCDRIDLILESTSGNYSTKIKTYSEPFVDRLCDE